MQTRRQFFGAAGLGVPLALSRAASPAAAFSFVLLGDLHFDKIEHHELDWLQREHPGDVSQVHNYSRITKEVHPHLFATVRETVSELNAAPGTHVPFVLHAGDFVEG